MTIRATARTTAKPLPPLRATAIEVDGTVTRPVRFNGPPGEALLAALHEAMLKRGCLRDRAHKGECLNCALLPRCGVWPLVAPADPTKRQRGVFVRPYVPRLPDLPPSLPVGARLTYGLIVVQDSTFPALWGTFAAEFVRAARQLAEWGMGDLLRDPDGPARRGAMSVGRVRWLNPVTGEAQPFVYTEGEAVVPPLWHESSEFQVPSSKLPIGDTTGAGAVSNAELFRVSFETPTRLVVGDETLRVPNCATLVRRIAERVETLCAGLRLAPPDDLDADAAVAAAARVQITENDTRWEGADKRGGLRGAVTYAGNADDLAAVLPALRWGEVLGVGKGAQAGAGRIHVTSNE